MRDRTGEKLGETGTAFRQPRRVLTSHFANFMHASFSETRPFNVEAKNNFSPQTGLLGLSIEGAPTPQPAK